MTAAIVLAAIVVLAVVAVLAVRATGRAIDAAVTLPAPDAPRHRRQPEHTGTTETATAILRRIEAGQ